jgi:crotonobetainyl-CoA:carnitine CoA-transferase CaiB-like acyl-CoA transferase
MLDVGTACLANQAMNYLVSGKVPQRTGNAHPNIQPQDVFATRDGHMVLVSATTVNSARPVRCSDIRNGRRTIALLRNSGRCGIARN